MNKAKKMISALHSEYIIDGIPQELTPAEILNEVSVEQVSAQESYDAISDDTSSPKFNACALSMEHMHYYASKVAALQRRCFPVSFPESGTKGLIAKTLIDSLWKAGHFRLGDLALEAKWNWKNDEPGNQAAFFASVAACAEYIDALGIKLQNYSVGETEDCSICFTPCIAHEVLDDDFMADSIPFQSEQPEIGKSLKIGSNIVPDPDSWLIYVPFDTCDYRLGGSLLSQAMDSSSDVAPETGDADYFIDCFELVRELVEDGILLSASTVAEGGLLSALRQMCGQCGATVNISEIKKSYQEQDAIRIMFSEVPGVIIQIKDIDFDYIDAEMLLQDVVYFPLGHPSLSSKDITVVDTDKSTIESILDSLIRSQSSEGED